MKYLIRLFSVGICLAIGFLGSVFTVDSIDTWYQTLNKPFFNPPNWIFGPVWTLLYILMGVALVLILETKKKDKSRAITLFGIQLVLNFFWSILFFYLESPLYAFIEICVLWFSIYLTIEAFGKMNKTAAWLLVPYLAWVSFASLLNLSIFMLNR